MYRYYVNQNAQPTGEHEVHREDCGHLPDFSNREYLGIFYNCHEAVRAARAKNYSNVDGCFYCCLDCHKK